MKIKQKVSQSNSNSIIGWVCSILLTIVFIGCNGNEVYYKYQESDNADWTQTSVLVFEMDSLDIPDYNATYDISLELTNNMDYPYQNLWLFAEYLDDDSTIVKFQKEFILADPYGKWLGSGFGSLFQTSHTIIKSHTFRKYKNYRISIQHGMQDEILHGIEKVGLKIFKTE